jgi:hypothetical protein
MGFLFIYSISFGLPSGFFFFFFFLTSFITRAARLICR